jgi:hypothetical protein
MSKLSPVDAFAGAAQICEINLEIICGRTSGMPATLSQQPPQDIHQDKLEVSSRGQVLGKQYKDDHQSECL